MTVPRGEPHFPQVTAPARLRALTRHDLHDLPGDHVDPTLGTLTQLAAQALRIDLVAVNIIDAARQITFAASTGEGGQLELRESFCAHVVERDETVLVPDVRLDGTFEHLALARAGAIVAYAATPLRSSDGQVLGTLCAVDTRPRDFTTEEVRELTAFARLAQAHLAQRAALRDARHERAQLQALLEAVPLATFATDQNGVVRLWNDAAQRMYGHPKDEVLGQPLPTLRAQDAQPTRTPGDLPVGLQEERRRTLDGRTLDTHVHRAELRDAQGALVLTVDVASDVTDTRRARRLLEQQSQVLEDMSEAVISCDLQYRVLTWNAAAARMYGYDWEDMVGRDFRTVIATRFDASGADAFYRDIHTRGSWEGQIVQTRRDGREVHVRGRTTLMRDVDGQPSGFVTVNEDVTERQALHAQLEHLAYTDAVTGLANRQALLRFLHERAPVWPCGVLFIDLDDFKLVNDVHGHAVGDAVLVETAARLRRAAPDAFIARFSGDEFVVVVTAPLEPLSVAEAVQRELDGLWTIGTRSVRLNASVGVAHGDEELPPGELLRRADVAMYTAKTGGKDRMAEYDDRTDEARQERAILAAELARGLTRGEVVLAWQPRVHLSEGHVVAVEALARWQHPERGLVSPGVFIPVAEESGLIHELGREVLRQACAQGQAWANTGRPVRIAVNVSAAELARDDVVQDVRDALTRSGLPPRLLEVEVTESAAMQDLHVNAEKLRALAELGVAVAIDDFGTGYSSLNYLRHLPARIVKVDQSFVRDLTSDTTGTARSIVRAIVTLAHGVQMRVVAEGVETEEQRAVLLALGCEDAQGFLFARPMPAEEVGRLLWR
ncbi:EAL domain-containing protein [Deinococcus pimensis]|uniref:EAL domain-containing protein n=1 Tax=Deinococcus pimensis TaxID=309888 RepID=UPI0004B4066F|nr:EAL domain-containing protein [Deinococcus pimensis]